MAGIRRTWDKEFFAKKAKDRSEQGDDFESESSGAAIKAKKFIKEEFQAASDGAAGPMGSQRAFIKSRDTRIDLETKVGKTELINPTSAESSRGAGFWCEVCSCLLKDSASYLDHINGKKHQRALGFSMRVERADVEAVKKRLDDLKSQVAFNKVRDSVVRTTETTFAEYEGKLNLSLVEQEAKKKRKREELQSKKKQQTNLDEFVGEEQDDDMAALMGFGGFGTTKK